jgi:hypothetical protein
MHDGYDLHPGKTKEGHYEVMCRSGLKNRRVSAIADGANQQTDAVDDLRKMIRNGTTGMELWAMLNDESVAPDAGAPALLT